MNLMTSKERLAWHMLTAHRFDVGSMSKAEMQREHGRMQEHRKCAWRT